jgi:hypothetical protein
MKVKEKQANLSLPGVQAWRKALSVYGFMFQLVITLVYILLLVIFMGYYFLYLEARTGTVLNDWLLNFLPPKDFSHYIFGLLYPAIIMGVVYVSAKPSLFLRVFQAAAIVYTARIFTLFIVKLNPPAGFIPLIDPFGELLGYGGKLVTKDLFFSGHITSLTILFLAVQKPWLKIFLLTAVVIMAVLLLWQHVHYTIDILGGIFFSMIGWKITENLSVPSLANGHPEGRNRSFKNSKKY